MKNLKNYSIIVALLLIANNYCNAQGCSDAGICTIPILKPGANAFTDSLSAKNNIRVGISRGAGDFNIDVNNAYLVYIRKISNKLSVDTRLTTQAQNGNSIKTAGISDIFLNANYRLGKMLRLNVGTKLPMRNANISNASNLSLPMNYQVSLGTVDAMMGLALNVKKLQFASGLQLPLTQNANQFLANNFLLDSVLKTIPNTNNFVRAADALLRASYQINMGKRLSVTPSLLPIFHLANDKYTDAAGVVQEIIGSKGLTLNTNMFLNYALSKKQMIQLILAAPLMVRDVRPDGLTRSFVGGIEYQLGF
jgi:hypothetical protein